MKTSSFALKKRKHVWVTYPGCTIAMQKFTRHWLTSQFTSWQCMLTPPGYAKTNYPAEQFNRELKRDYSLRGLVSLTTSAELLRVCCHHRSVRVKPFEVSAVPTDELIRRSCL